MTAIAAMNKAASVATTIGPFMRSPGCALRAGARARVATPNAEKTAETFRSMVSRLRLKRCESSAISPPLHSARAIWRCSGLSSGGIASSRATASSTAAASGQSG